VTGRTSLASGGRKPPAISNTPPRGACAPRSPFLPLAALLLFVAALHADDVPLVGRPADLPFSGASAGFDVVSPGPEYRVPFALEAAATPTDVEESEPVTLTVSVRARGKVRHPPTRLDLRQLPSLSRRFHIEDVTDGQGETVSPYEWRWVYRLRPRGPGVREVPGVPFVFYNPDLRPAEKAFQVVWSDPVPLRVRPSERNAPPVAASDAVLVLATGPGVLRAGPAWNLSTAGWFLTALGPPAVCGLWYLRWRRRHPDEARLAHQRRSRAARAALGALDHAGREQGRECADRVAAVVAGYLADRFGLSSAEPTSPEVVDFLRRCGLPDSLIERGGRLLDRTSAGRFGPEETLATADEARAWIIAIEEEPWPPSS
jgi:hypothetical protein